MIGHRAGLRNPIGVSPMEYRELEAGTSIAELGDLRPDLQAVRLTADALRWDLDSLTYQGAV
jgi:hypothetical protein